MPDLPPWWQIVAAVVVYLLSLAVYRLAFHPLSRFAGPKLAAITRYYEGYFDLYQNGQYTFKIAELHKKYGKLTLLRPLPGKHSSSNSYKGPIIRISPHELHVSDPVFFDTLYRQDTPYDKYHWAVDAFAAKGATLFTTIHHDHMARRQQISPLFSKAKVASRQDLIHRHMDKLCRRVS